MQFQTFDESYVERLRAGDFRTQEHFVAYFSELLQLKLRSRLHSPQAIEDVRQETFARVLAALRGGKIRQPERLGAYVNSMCNNVLLEHYRASQRDSSLEDGFKAATNRHETDPCRVSGPTADPSTFRPRPRHCHSSNRLPNPAATVADPASSTHAT